MRPLPATGRRHPFWKDVPDEQWEDRRWQRQHAIRSATQLAELIDLPDEEVKALEALESKYRTAIPPYYFSLINVDDPNDPIRIQAVPTSQEAFEHFRERARRSVGRGSRFAGPRSNPPLSGPSAVDHDAGLQHVLPVLHAQTRHNGPRRLGRPQPRRAADDRVRPRPSRIRDVIVSGGDPLTLPVAQAPLVRQRTGGDRPRRRDPHRHARAGHAAAAAVRQRIGRTCASAGKIWIQTHFNHPVEITPEAARACRNLINAGMPVNNHTVLMKGVNDSVPVMCELIRGLLRIKVRPYYLFHCDPVTGAGHFRTSIWKGMEIIEGLRGHVSGLGIPTYVVDGLHGAGKIPIMPNYMLSASDDAVILRNYEGMIFRYAPEDKHQSAKRIVSDGVSGLLSGGNRPIVPDNSPRMARRRKVAAEKVAAATTLVTTISPLVPLNGSESNGKSGNGTATSGHSNGKTNHSVASGKNGAPEPTNGQRIARPNGKANGKSNGVALNLQSSDRANAKGSAKSHDDLAIPASKAELLRRPAGRTENRIAARKPVGRTTKKNLTDGA